MFEELNVAQLKDKKIKDVYTRVYGARETFFRSNETVLHEITARKQLPDGDGGN